MTTIATPPARKRPKKIRTKTVNDRPALVVSALPLNHVDLRPDAMCLVCPDCGTWCPISGHQGSTPKLVPHHTEPAGSSQARRCFDGSDRRVILDLTVAEWARGLGDGVSDVASRRATRVLRKPKTPPAPAASKMAPRLLSAESVRQMFRTHLAQCRACRGEATDRTGEPLPCLDGGRLAGAYLQALDEEPKRAKLRAFVARERARFDRQYTKQAAKGRAAEWTKHQSTTTAPRRLAKRSGTTVEEQNNTCKRHPQTVLSEFRGPEVPRQPLRIEQPVRAT